jgi:hypothetical protein
MCLLTCYILRVLYPTPWGGNDTGESLLSVCVRASLRVCVCVCVHTCVCVLSVGVWHSVHCSRACSDLAARMTE